MTACRRHLVDALAIVLASTAPVVATAGGQVPQSGPVVELRYRYEGVDDDAFARRADASTLRLRLGYRWLFAPGWQVHVDGEHVRALFGERYNSSANGKLEYPVVADPRSDEINQAWIGYADDASSATLGRQRVQLDNQRFFGNSGWRQNEQTFDALALRHAFGGDAPIVRYLWLGRVLRVNGHENPDPLLREWRLRGHLLDVGEKLPLGMLAGYGYWVENRDVATLSTRTLGLRWTGTHAVDAATLGWSIEYARQSDWVGNPAAQRANYRLLEPTLQWHGVTWKAGWEVLGGDGHYGFATPYATLHAFNGWADRFLVTPKDGLDDRHVGASGKFGRTTWTIAWHAFRADHGGARYGDEFDASLDCALGAHLDALLKFAGYRSDGFASDERKLWASLEYRY
jgi:hypothetical protein